MELESYYILYMIRLLHDIENKKYIITISCAYHYSTYILINMIFSQFTIYTESDGKTIVI